MSTIPLPALQVQPPRTDNVLDTYGKMLSLRNLLAQQQLIPVQQQIAQEQLRGARLSNQQTQYQIGAQQALNRSYQNAVRTDSDGVPQIDGTAIANSLASGGYGSQIPGVLKNINDFNKSFVDLRNSVSDLQAKSNDLKGAAAEAVRQAGYDPKLAHTLLDVFPPSPQINALRSMIDTDPAQFRQMIDGVIAQSPKATEIEKNTQQAKDAAANAQRTQQQSEFYQKNGMAPGVPVDAMEMASWLRNNPGKTPSDFLKYQKTLVPQFNFNLQAQGGPQNPAASQGKTGQDFLATLPPQRADLIKAIAEGRRTLPSGAAMRSPYWQGIQNDLFAFDPQWSEQRAELRKAFVTGQDGRNIGSLNTAAVHLDTFADAARALSNGPLRPGNAIYNALATQFGSSAPTTFEGLRSAVAGEMANALKGSATDPEIASIKSTISQQNSPKQLADWIDSNLHIISQKLNTYRERYQQQNPDDTSWSPVLPSAQRVFDKHGTRAAASGLTVTDPLGTVHTFPTQQAADAFRKAAGIQ